MTPGLYAVVEFCMNHTGRGNPFWLVDKQIAFCTFDVELEKINSALSDGAEELWNGSC